MAGADSSRPPMPDERVPGVWCRASDFAAEGFAVKSGRRYWSMMGRTGVENGQSTPAASGWFAVGTVTAYAAAIVAFGYALMSLYWALGGHALVSTIGVYWAEFARRGWPIPVLVALAATLAKAVGGLLALAPGRPWGRG